MKPGNYSRKNFIAHSLTGGIALAGMCLLPGCGEKHEEEVAPAEDLMREHGLLNRVLLIYDTCKENLLNGTGFAPEALANSAGIIRSFIEDYHEKMEEEYLFTRFERANEQTDLVKVLRKQHDAGRAITSQIMAITKAGKINTDDNQKLVQLLSLFNVMYRPHEAREDTILFPAFKKIVSKHEYDSLGEEFERIEHQHFGEDGFETMLDKVAAIEKQLGIYELNKFTPKL